jgi:ABC-2 type transport system permease protein
VLERLRELSAYREIVWNLVRKELKVKYTASVLGAIWSLLNPVVFLAVFSFVVRVLGAGVEAYPVFLVSGLLAWNLLNASLSNGSQSVIANANLVKKVYFPREILPIATIGVALVDFVLQSAVLFAFLLVFGYGFALATIWLYPIAFVALLAFTTAVTLLVSALNVRYRDVQHLVGLGVLVWFWMTPIVYPGHLVQERLDGVDLGFLSAWQAYLLNPMVTIVTGFQRALYTSDDVAQVLPTMSTAGLAAALGIVIAVSVGLLFATWRLYFSMSGDFAEEL